MKTSECASQTPCATTENLKSDHIKTCYEKIYVDTIWYQTDEHPWLLLEHDTIKSAKTIGLDYVLLEREKKYLTISCSAEYNF